MKQTSHDVHWRPDFCKLSRCHSCDLSTCVQNWHICHYLFGILAIFPHAISFFSTEEFKRREAERQKEEARQKEEEARRKEEEARRKEEEEQQKKESEAEKEEEAEIEAKMKEAQLSGEQIISPVCNHVH